MSAINERSGASERPVLDEKIGTIPKKIHILGCPGSGKSTLAKLISAHLNYPYIELDLVKRPNHRRPKVPFEQRKEVVSAYSQQSNWVAEGVYTTWTTESFDKADLIVFLDVPRKLSLRQAARRAQGRVSDTGIKKEMVTLAHVLTYHTPATRKTFHPDRISSEYESRRKSLEAVSPYTDKTIVLKSREDVAKFLATLGIEPEQREREKGKSEIRYKPENIERKRLDLQGDLTDQELKLLREISERAVKVAGDDAKDFIIVGGVALRLLEKLAGIKNTGIFSGYDIDTVYIGHERDTVVGRLNDSFKDLHESLQVGIEKVLDESELKATTPQNHLVLNKDGGFSFACLNGKIRADIAEPLEVLEIKIDEQHTINVFSPAIFFHFYALRAVGGVKSKDWKEKKHQRLLEIIRSLNNSSDLNVGLKMPSDYPELREMRKKARNGLMPKWLLLKAYTHEIAVRNREMRQRKS